VSRQKEKECLFEKRFSILELKFDMKYFLSIVALSYQTGLPFSMIKRKKKS